MQIWVSKSDQTKQGSKSLLNRLGTWVQYDWNNPVRTKVRREKKSLRVKIPCLYLCENHSCCDANYLLATMSQPYLVAKDVMSSRRRVVFCFPSVPHRFHLKCLQWGGEEVWCQIHRDFWFEASNQFFIF